jgi:hypothetical protein
MVAKIPPIYGDIVEIEWQYVEILAKPGSL